MTGVIELERDIKAYTRSLIEGDYVTGSRIEKKYGLYGATPEYVSTVLSEMAAERAVKMAKAILPALSHEAQS